ncbi:MAG: IS21 family transposase [Gammaproteobacteria bacterium]|nr:MAG: IS21 family transposase [Gammaproteobacteria bacterium]
MAQKRLSMRKIHEILRLHYVCKLSNRAIARSVNSSHSVVGECLRRAREVGIGWPLPAALDDARLEQLLYPPPPAPSTREMPLPNWAEVHQELRHKGVTLLLLWQEYHRDQPDGFRYSRFCELYQKGRKHLKPSLRQTHKAGEKCFVDYAGATVPVVDPDSGELREAAIFVGVLGASSYTYAEAHFGQTLPNWTGAHARMFGYFGGSSVVLIPDNLKAAVKKPCWYEPDINPTYQDLAIHYATAVVPARPRKPKEKAKAEVGVQVVQRWILARLRKRTFFSLLELNQAIAELLEDLNHRTMRHFGLSRAELFARLDQPALQPLPEHAYEFAEWKTVGVNIDYHVDFDGHYYSVHYSHISRRVEVRATAFTVEVHYKGKPIAAHKRSSRKGYHTTAPEHRPKSHQNLTWSPQRLTRWARSFGPHTEQFVTALIASRTHPEHAYRSCLGLLRLGKRTDEGRLEAACRRTLHFGIRSYQGVKNILANRLDEQPLDDADQLERPLSTHANVRGKPYYR